MNYEYNARSSDYNYQSNYNNKSNRKYDKLLKIWDHRIMIRDINNTTRIYHFVLYSLLAALMIIWGIIFNVNIVIPLTFLVIGALVYSFMFYYDPEIRAIANKHHNIMEVNPCNKFCFFYDSKHPDILLIKDSDSRHLYGLFSYKVTVVPSSIHSNFDAFLRILYQNKIDFTYKFIHKPATDEKLEKKTKEDSIVGTLIKRMTGVSFKNYKTTQRKKIPLNLQNHGKDSYEIRIMFYFYNSVKYGYDINPEIKIISEKIVEQDYLIKSLFKQNFTHYQIQKIAGKELNTLIQDKFFIPINYYNTKNLSNSLKEVKKDERLAALNILPDFKSSLKKIAYYLYYLVTANVLIYALFQSIPLLLKILVFADIIIVLILLSPILSEYVSFKTLIQNNEGDRVIFNPFAEMRYFRFVDKPNILFGYCNKYGMLFALKNYILSGIPAYFECDGDKFLRTYIAGQRKSSISYSIFYEPYNVSDFLNEQFNGLNVENKLLLRDREDLNHEILGVLEGDLGKLKTSDHWNLDEKRAEQWMNWRFGIYKTTHLFECFAFRFTNRIDSVSFNQLIQELKYQYLTLQSAIETSFINAKLSDINTFRLLLRTYTLNSIKIPKIFKFGTGLYQIPIQSKNLSNMTILSGEVKKGIKTHIPVEFNTPTNHFAAIDFARIYNTQTHKAESKTGFELTQLFDSKVAIAGDNKNLIDIWSLAIANNGIKKGLKFIVFDTNGSFNCLYNLNKRSR
ncbi:MAG: hypothetical protein GF364_22440, partial [Candidatus Lokiarchaeota archaeon]|nr:hypothetical protein [Candidatus Lokiarchaeota archaeon]